MNLEREMGKKSPSPVRKIPRALIQGVLNEESRIISMLKNGKADKKEEKDQAGNIVSTSIFDKKGKKIYFIEGRL